jgi:hypothetical protein
MSQFKFSLATLADDDQLGELLAATPMEGRISIAFGRRPSYFAASAVDGRTVQVGVARDVKSNRVIGMGSRAVGLRYVNGESIPVGYLSGLRLLKEFRGQAGLLARGYRFLRELHRDQTASYYLTTVAADNEAAAAVLTSGRAGLPIYHPIGNYHTVSIAVPAVARRSAGNTGAIVLRTAAAHDRDAILTFLHEQRNNRQYVPVYEPQDLFSSAGLLKGLAPHDILLAVHQGQIVGTLAGWNQREFKQIIVHSYAGWLSSMRPLYNAWASVRHQPLLPKAGSALQATHGAIPIVRDDDVEVFQQLLWELLSRLQSRGERLLLIGLHESDPFLPIVRRHPGREYLTKMYVVHWPGEGPDFDQLKQRAPYLELGCL